MSLDTQHPTPSSSPSWFCLRTQPKHEHIAAAHLKKGLSLIGMNKTAQGVVQLQYLIEHFPKTDEARIAGDRLKEIGVKP